MNVRFATDKERNNWDALLSRNPDGGNIFQSKELTEFKQRSGWTPRFLIIENFDKNKSLAIAIQEKRIFGLGTLWYACKGPGITNVAQLEKIVKPLQVFAGRHGVFAVKMESEILKSPETIAEMKQLGLEIVRPIQPNYSTVVLDISPTKSEEELLRAMPKKGAKYAINRALRDGVTVEEVPCTSQNAHAFYDLWVETAQSAGFISMILRITMNSGRLFAKIIWDSYSSPSFKVRSSQVPLHSVLRKNQLTKTVLASVSAKLMAHHTFYSGVLFSGRVSEGSQRMTYAERRQATVSTTKRTSCMVLVNSKRAFQKRSLITLERLISLLMHENIAYGDRLLNDYY